MKTIRANLETRRDLLRSSELFAGVPEEACGELASGTSLRAFEAGEFLFQQGETADGFYVVAEGRVKICRFAPDGREQVLHVMGPGDLCGEVPVFQGGRYPASAIAAGAGRGLYVPGDRFLALAESHPEVLLEMLAVLSMRLRRFVALIDDLSLKEISARLAKHLLDLRARQGADTVRLETTKTLLAGRLGTVAETLSRTFGKMQRRCMIESGGKTIRLLDADALAALAAGEKL